MAPNKIKLHNLDEEVINYFLNKDTKIIYDYLAEDIISDIKNDSSDIGYNDTELRNRIISLEDNKIDTSVIQSNYYNKTETYSRSEIDLLISNNNELINQELNNKLSIENAQAEYLLKQDGVITENLLSNDLLLKVNARYNNQRPSTGGGESGGGISESEFELLKAQVTVNTNNLTDLQNYVDNNVLSINDKITTENLDDFINTTLNNARSIEDPIELTDLSEEVQGLIQNGSSGGGDVGSDEFDALKIEVDNLKTNFKLNPGEVMIGKEPLGQVKKAFIFDNDVIIVSKSANLEDAQNYASLNHKIAVIDLEANKVYAEGDISTYSFEEVQDTTGTEYLVGKFALEYNTNNLYFGNTKDNAVLIVDMSVINNELTTYKSEIETIKSRLDALEETGAGT